MTLEPSTEKRAEQQGAVLRRILELEAACLARCRISGLVEGFEWPARSRAGRIYTAAHRAPPLPFHSFERRGAGFCRVCGQETGSERRTWHPECLEVYTLWTKPGDYARALAFRQADLCPVSGQTFRLTPQWWPKGVEIDHEFPLFRVPLEHADEPWFDLLRFWGLDNLRALSRDGHVMKSAEEACWRAGRRASAPAQGVLV